MRSMVLNIKSISSETLSENIKIGVSAWKFFILNVSLILIAALLPVILATGCSRNNPEVMQIDSEKLLLSNFQLLYKYGKNEDEKSVTSEEFLNHIADVKLLAMKAREMKLDTLSLGKNVYNAREKDFLLLELGNHEIMSKVTISEKELMDSYNNSADERVVKKLTFKTREQAQETLDKIRKGEESFENKGRLMQPDPLLAEPYKDYGFVKAEIFPEDLQKIILSLNAGEVSDVIPSTSGYTLYTVTDMRGNKYGTFEKNREKFYDDQLKEKAYAKREAYLDSVSSSINFEIDNKAREALIPIIKECNEKQLGYNEKIPVEIYDMKILKYNDNFLTIKDLRDLWEGSSQFSRPMLSEYYLDVYMKKAAIDNVLVERAKSLGLDKTERAQCILQWFRELSLHYVLKSKFLGESGEVTDQEITDYYNANKESFLQPERIVVTEILTESEQEIQKAYEKLEKGEEIEKVSKEMSVGKTSFIGGRLGPFKRELRPEYYNIAENLELGTYSKPQKVAQGWVILMLKMKIPPTEYPLEQVKTHLKNQLINKRVDAKIDSILKELKAQHTLKSYPEKLSLMK